MKTILFQIKYLFIQLVREKQFLFWLLFFPIILSTFFYFAFSKLDSTENINVNLGICEENQLVNIINKIPIMKITKSKDEKDLENKLRNKEIDAFLNDENELIVLESNIKTNISLNVLEEIKRYSLAYAIKLKKEGKIDLSEDEILNLELSDIVKYTNENKLNNFSNNDFSIFLNRKIRYKDQETSTLKIILFTALSMFSMYGAYVSIHTSNLIQGNLSNLAIRVGMSPCKKSKLIISSFLVALIINIFFNLIIISYITFILKVNLIDNIFMTSIILLAASAYGISLGLLLGVVKRIKYDIKIALLNMFFLFLSFICGMGGDLSFRESIEKNIPILNRINPINLVNQSLYKVNLVYTNVGLRENLLNLTLLSIIIMSIAIVFLRRKSYDNL